MATKHKHGTKHAAINLLQQARRRLEKGDFKQAVKDAKVCYRQAPNPEARRLLEQAYLGRCRQLHRAGLRAESQAAAENLLELGVTDEAVRRRIARGVDRRRAFASPGGGGCVRRAAGRCQQSALSSRRRSCRAAARGRGRYAGDQPRSPIRSPGTRGH